MAEPARAAAAPRLALARRVLTRAAAAAALALLLADPALAGLPAHAVAVADYEIDVRLDVAPLASLPAQAPLEPGSSLDEPNRPR